MKFFMATGPDKFAFGEMEIPKPKDYEVLVKNEGCLVCNSTEWMIIDHLFATPDYPVAFGHECFGEVIEVGPKVKNFKLGDRVICANAIPTGYDGKHYSSWGGFAEYGIAGDYEALIEDGQSVTGEYSYRQRYSANYKIDPTFPMEEAGLIFPLSETASCILQVPEVEGKDVAVFGTGTAGYTAAMFAKLKGAKTVTVFGIDKQRAEFATTLGADYGLLSEEAYKSDKKYDVVFEITGSFKVFTGGLPFLKEGGILAVYGKSTRPYEIDLANIPVNFSVRTVDPKVDMALEEVEAMMKAGKIPVKTILTHIWEFDDIEKALHQVKNQEVIKGLVKIVPDPLPCRENKI